MIGFVFQKCYFYVPAAAAANSEIRRGGGDFCPAESSCTRQHSPACQRRARSSVADAQDSAILESFAFNSLDEREAIRIAAIFLCNCLSTGETW